MVKYKMRYGDIEHTYEAETVDELLNLCKVIDNCPNEDINAKIADVKEMNLFTELLEYLDNKEKEKVDQVIHIKGMVKEDVINSLKLMRGNIPKGLIII